MRRLHAYCLVLILTLLALSLNSQTISPGEEPEELFLSFRYRNIINTYITGFYYDGGVYLSLNELFDILQINFNIDEERDTVEGFFVRDANRYAINFTESYAVYEGRSIHIERSHYIRVGGEYFLLPTLFSELFGLRLNVHLSTLSLSMIADDSIPVIQAYQRVLRRKYAPRAEDISAHAPLVFHRDHSWISGGIMDYEFTGTSYFGGEQFYSSALTMGGELVGGDAQLMYRGSYTSESISSNTLRARWRYVVDHGGTGSHNYYLSQIHLGDIVTEGLNRYSLYGASLTNQPIEPRRHYETYRYAGITQPEWEVDLHINNRLYDSAVADANGNFVFDIPLIYGSSLIELRYYGHYGEYREETQRVEIPHTILPPGEVVYHLQGGKFYHTHNNAAQARISGGISSRITGSLGYEYSELPLYRNSVVYASVSAMPTLRTFMTLDAAPSLYYKFSADQLLNLTTRIGGEVVYYDRESPQYRSGMQQQYDLHGIVPVSVARLPVYLRASGSYINYERGHSRRLTFDLNTNLSGISLFTGIRMTQDQRSGADYNTALLRFGLTYRMPRSTGIAHGLLIRARMEMDISDGNTENYSVSASRNIWRNGRVEFDFQRNAFLNANVFNFQLKIDFDALRSFSSVRKDPRRSSYSQRVFGSVAYDQSASRFVAYNRGWVGTAGASVRMFVDYNGNGIYDPGEPIVENAQVKYRRPATQTRHSDGISRTRELLPYVRYSVDVHEISLPNPLWIPKYKSFSFVADPNRFKNIDIPLTVAGEIEGKVVRASAMGYQGIGGLRVVIENMETGEIWNTRTFSDGSFYQMGLPPGMYEITIDPEQKRGLRLQTEQDKYITEIRPTEYGDFIEGFVISLSNQE